MLCSIAQQLLNTRIVLASGSPRRREILTPLLPSFEVIPSTFEEDIDKSTVDSAADYVQRTAAEKGREVQRRLLRTGEWTESTPTLIISSDTVVVSPEGRILEKPADATEAETMLGSLSGRAATVITGLVLLHTGKGEQICHETTTVHFGVLEADTIAAYIATAEPYDKAGGFGIQGAAGAFVSKIEGCYFNVVGFPQHRFCKELCVFLRDS